MQDAAELRSKNRATLEVWLIDCLGIVVFIALALMGFWVGAFFVVAVVGAFYYRRRFHQKVMSKFVTFRERFLRVLKEAEDVTSEMLIEDKVLLQECKDSILFPFAIASNRRREISAIDLWDLKTLLEVYDGYTVHRDHLSGSSPEDCKLCLSAHRVRRHIEGALTKFEFAVESMRQILTTKIDDNNKEGGDS